MMPEAVHLPDPRDPLPDLTGQTVVVIGAGVIGLWQARTCALAGASVTLIAASFTEHARQCDREHSRQEYLGRDLIDDVCDDREHGPRLDPKLNEDRHGSCARASWYAGGMLAPDCEGEVAEPIVSAMGHASIELWRDVEPSFRQRGTLVVAPRRDSRELDRYGAATTGSMPLDAAAIAALEPELAGRFDRGLLFANEAHVSTRPALATLFKELTRLGVSLRTGLILDAQDAGEGTTVADLVLQFDHVIDARGRGAQDTMPDLRGVRGEMAVLVAPKITLQRPIRLLHPRFPLYICPWGDDRYMVGATVIETQDAGPVTARSAVELLNAAYAVHPGFAEARIAELGAGVRPAFADNTPRVVGEGAVLRVNGAYRHGFLTAPMLARLACAQLACV